MLRTNLATRPFYNERAAHVLIALAAIVVLGVTVFNLMRIVSLSRHNTELSTRVDAEQAEARRMTAEAAKIRVTMNKQELELVVGAAEEANTLIDQRTFSWTEFFNVIESTLPKKRPLDIRETPEFLAIAARVRDGLRAGHSYED